MATERSYFWHMSTEYRYLENLGVSDSGALYKRAGSSLIEASTKNIKIVTTSDFVYIFFSDDTYKVLDRASKTDVLGLTPLPPTLTFQILQDAKIGITEASGLERPLLGTSVGVFYADASHALEKAVFTGSTTFTNPKLFIVVAGRGLVAEGSSLYFSTYDSIFDFTQIAFNAPNAPSASYSLRYAVGLDGDILDIVYFKTYIFVGTSRAIYRVDYSVLNPFAESVLRSTTPARIDKIFSKGLKYPTMVVVGNFVIFATDRGIHGIVVNTSIVSGTATTQASIDIVELTKDCEHLTSEDAFFVIKTASNFRREDSFFALRNDGVIFKFNLAKPDIFVTRYVGGLDQKTSRKYVDFSHDGSYLVSEKNGFYYLEQQNQFPYLNDNKLVFSWHDALAKLEKFNFLDCTINQSSLILDHPTNILSSTFDLKTDIPVPASIIVLRDGVEYGDHYESVKLLSKVSTASGFKYTANIDLTENDLILGVRKTHKDIDFSLLEANAKGQDIYVTYANINIFPFRLDTVKFEKDVTQLAI